MCDFSSSSIYHCKNNLKLVHFGMFRVKELLNANDWIQKYKIVPKIVFSGQRLAHSWLSVVHFHTFEFSLPNGINLTMLESRKRVGSMLLEMFKANFAQKQKNTTECHLINAIIYASCRFYEQIMYVRSDYNHYIWWYGKSKRTRKSRCWLLRGSRYNVSDVTSHQCQNLFSAQINSVYALHWFTVGLTQRSD